MKDISGILVSVACILHCLFMPVLIGFFSFAASLSIFVSEFFHVVILLIAIGVAAYSFFSTYFQHHSLKPMTVGAIGLVFLLSALLFNHSIEILFTVVGSLCLSLAHWINFNLTNNKPPSSRLFN
ncbi:MerC domain-containing protein [Aliikangiella maris]|uniref:MerC domain-containing protein n=2 Tax=Aliikangiella maris TaxID=3162458 RepID=A0ABV2BVQ8_9GAMM